MNRSTLSAEKQARDVWTDFSQFLFLLTNIVVNKWDNTDIKYKYMVK